MTHSYLWHYPALHNINYPAIYVLFSLPTYEVVVTGCTTCLFIKQVHHFTYNMPIAVAARSKAWKVFVHSNAGIVGSKPTQGMDVCVRLFCAYVVLCVGSGLATGWSTVQGVLPTVYRIKKLKKRPGSNKGL
jgi:hypothetical protein